MSVYDDFQALLEKIREDSGLVIGVPGILPIYNAETAYRNIEDKWNLYTEGIRAIVESMAEALESLPDIVIERTYPVGICIDFAADVDPNTLYPWMSWAREDFGNVVFTAQSDSPDAPYYVGMPVMATGNLRNVPVPMHWHGLDKHGHLTPTYTDFNTIDTSDPAAIEVSLPNFDTTVMNGLSVFYKKASGQSQKFFDTNPRSATSSPVYIGTREPIANPPVSSNNDAAGQVGCGNIDPESRGTEVPTTQTSKYPYILDLKTQPYGEAVAQIDVTPKGRAYLRWRRVS